MTTREVGGTCTPGVRCTRPPGTPHPRASPWSDRPVCGVEGTDRGPIPLKGPGRTGGIRVYPPLCGVDVGSHPYPTPHGVSLSPTWPRQDRGDSGVSAAVWGGNWKSSALGPPTGPPIPPKRPTQDREDLGVSAAVWGGIEGRPYPTPPPRGVPIPQTAQAGAEGLGCVRRCVGGKWKGLAYLTTPRGAPIPQTV